MPVAMPLKTDPDSLGFLLNDTSRLMRQSFERRIAAIGLQITPGEARALIYVAANEGARQSVIADRMGVEPMTVCGYIDRLEKIGLVSRQPDPADRRAKNVTTTDTAEAMIIAIRGEARIVVEQAQAGLDAATRALLTAALRQVRGNLFDMLGDKSDIQSLSTEVQA
jgi:MarR family transcriptional regulator, transcriptional regulator for hemolysin